MWVYALTSGYFLVNAVWDKSVTSSNVKNLSPLLRSDLRSDQCVCLKLYFVKSCWLVPLQKKVSTLFFSVPTKFLSGPFMIDTQCVACAGLTAHIAGTHTHTFTHTLSVSGYSNDSLGVAECYYSLEGSHSSKWPLGAHMCF